MKENILVIGAGPIGLEYYRIFKHLEQDVTVIGRSEKSAAEFVKGAPDAKVLLGGLDSHLDSLKGVNFAVVAVSEDQLHVPCEKLIAAGVKHILVEKPGAASFEDLVNLSALAQKSKTEVLIAYNRRSLASVRELKARMAAEGGCKSFVFDFTERGYVVAPLEKNPGVKERWFWHNSTHVVDLAFYLGGKPREMSSRKSGHLDWHPAGSTFVGSGTTDSDALFSYHANWAGPGRWALEFVTDKSRYFLRPIEKLSVQKLGSMAIEEVALEDQADRDFKPGFLLQCQSFLKGSKEGLVELSEQLNMLPVYQQILSGDRRE